MGSSRAEIHNEIALTRKRMAETVGELESRIESRVESVRERLDVAAIVREHPWLSLGAALAAGYAVTATAADRHAARAVADAARELPATAKNVTASAVEAVKERFATDDAEASEPDVPMPKRPLLERLAAHAGDLLADALQPHVEKLGAEMRTAAAGLTTRLAGTAAGTPTRDLPRSPRPLVGGSGAREVAAFDGTSGHRAEA